MEREEAPPPLHHKASNPQSRKKKKMAQTHALSPLNGDDLGLKLPLPSMKPPKVSRKSMKNGPSPSFQHLNRPSLYTLKDSLKSNSDYRILRHKYLMLEEESTELGKELVDIEAEVKTLEDEKVVLLDKLVVLEGLIDPSEIPPNRC